MTLHTDPHHEPPDAITLRFHGETWLYVPVWSWALFDTQAVNLWASDAGVVTGKEAERCVASNNARVAAIAVGKALRALADRGWRGDLRIQGDSRQAVAAIRADELEGLWVKVHALIEETTLGHAWAAERIGPGENGFCKMLASKAKRENSKRDTK